MKLNVKKNSDKISEKKVIMLNPKNIRIILIKLVMIEISNNILILVNKN